MSEEVNVKGDYSDQRSPGESVRRADGEEVTGHTGASVCAPLYLHYLCHSRVAPEPHAKEVTKVEHRSYLTPLTH